MAPIAVIGASGGVGRAAVKQLLQQGREVRAIGRSKEKLQKLFDASDQLQIVEASVEDKESLTAALDGVSGVINACAGSSYWSAAGVDRQGSGNVAEVAHAAGVHVVLISSRLVTSRHRFHLFRMILNNVRYSMMDHKLKGEELLRKSGAAYTIIRPGHLTNSPGGSNELEIGGMVMEGLRQRCGGGHGSSTPPSSTYRYIHWEFTKVGCTGRFQDAEQDDDGNLGDQLGRANGKEFFNEFSGVANPPCDTVCSAGIHRAGKLQARATAARLGHVSRADVAAVAIAALDHPAASNRKTIDLSVKAHNTPPAHQLLHVFDGTVLDD